MFNNSTVLKTSIQNRAAPGNKDEAKRRLSFVQSTAVKSREEESDIDGRTGYIYDLHCVYRTLHAGFKPQIKHCSNGLCGGLSAQKLSGGKQQAARYGLGGRKEVQFKSINRLLEELDAASNHVDILRTLVLKELRAPYRLD